MNQEMSLELVVGGSLPVITSNFDALKTMIAERLEAYKIQVTEENLAQAKKDATELGKAALQLNKLKTEKAKEFSAPVEAFKAQVLELVGMIQEGQEFIKKQVKVFEDKTRALCLEQMTAALRGAWLTLGVRQEYQKGAVDTLVGISKLTPAGKLKKAASDEIFALAQADRGKQDLVDGRLARVTADCLTAGLKTPLVRAHVENILMEPDTTYTIGLENLIKIEIRRQEETLKKEQERMNREAKEKAEKEAKEKADREAKEEEAKRKAQEPPAPPPPPAMPPTPPQIPQAAPLPPAQPIFQGPMTPQKAKLSVVVRFSIETHKHTATDLEAVREWFQRSIQNIPELPPFTVAVMRD